MDDGKSVAVIKQRGWHLNLSKEKKTTNTRMDLKENITYLKVKLKEVAKVIALQAVPF